MMHRRFGRLPWRDLFAEAIRYAARRLRRDAALTGISPREHLACLRADRRSAATFLHDGSRAAGRRADRPARSRPHPGGDRRRGRRVPSTAAPRRAASRPGCAEAGALVARADLAEFEAERQEPIAIDYRGFTVLEAPPNSTGFVLLAGTEDRREFRPRRRWASARPTWCMCMVEAKKLAFADRERWGADPRTLEAPLGELLSAEYAARLAARIDLRAGRADPRRSPTRPATRPISAPPTATATRSPASRASTAAGARG